MFKEQGLWGLVLLKPFLSLSVLLHLRSSRSAFVQGGLHLDIHGFSPCMPFVDKELSYIWTGGQKQKNRSKSDSEMPGQSLIKQTHLVCSIISWSMTTLRLVMRILRWLLHLDFRPSSSRIICLHRMQKRAQPRHYPFSVLFLLQKLLGLNEDGKTTTRKSRKFCPTNINYLFDKLMFWRFIIILCRIIWRSFEAFNLENWSEDTDKMWHCRRTELI